MAKKLAKSAHSQKRVLDAAAKIFRDYGYAGTTMRAIAEEAELQAGSIYYHYKSKDDLIGAVLDIGINAVMDTVKAAMAALPDDATGAERIETAVRPISRPSSRLATTRSRHAAFSARCPRRSEPRTSGCATHMRRFGRTSSWKRKSAANFAPMQT